MERVGLPMAFPPFFSPINEHMENGVHFNQDRELRMEHAKRNKDI
jgi:hypothetical protein